MMIIAMVILLCTAQLSFAETIHFKDGRKVTAKIIEKSEKALKVDINGVNMTYFPDEISDIDGRPLTPQISAPGASLENQLKAVGSSEKKELILKFIETFGTRRAMEQNFDQMLSALEQRKPDQAKHFRESIHIDEIIDRLVPLYDKYFTTEDLKSYIAFYSSDQGKKLIQNIGLIMKESIDVATGYFKEKFPEINSEK